MSGVPLFSIQILVNLKEMGVEKDAMFTKEQVEAINLKIEKHLQEIKERLFVTNIDNKYIAREMERYCIEEGSSCVAIRIPVYCENAENSETWEYVDLDLEGLGYVEVSGVVFKD